MIAPWPITGRGDDARGLLDAEKAAELDPHAELREDLGEYYEQLGQRDNAIESYRRTVMGAQMFPPPPNSDDSAAVQAALDRLKRLGACPTYGKDDC